VLAGSRALSIFAYALNARTLRAHADGALRASDLEETIGWAPQTSLRAAVANLCELGVLAKRDPSSESRCLTTEITSAGRDLLTVADRLEYWLLHAPKGPIQLDGAAAAGAIRALIGGWDSTIVRVLAERPLTLTELNSEIPDISYPALERRLSKLRSTNLVTAIESTGKGKPYAVSDWLCHAIAPLAVAGRWERSYMADNVAPISHVEVEASFLLTLRLVELSHSTTGACALAVLTSAGDAGGEERQVAGVTLGVREGEIVSCSSDTASDPPTWALGTSDAWLEAVVDGRLDALRVRGAKPDLPMNIVQDIHDLLFPPLSTANLRVLDTDLQRFAGR